MIIDKIENADLYFDSVPRLEQFMHFFNNNDFEDFAAGKIKLDGDDLFVNIIDLKGKDEKSLPFEAHKDYIDIQIPLTADEQMGWKAQEDCQNVTAEYDEGKDVELYKEKATTMLNVPVGHFVIFFPSDAHQPGIAPKGTEFRKLIVKTRVEN